MRHILLLLLVLLGAVPAVAQPDAVALSRILASRIDAAAGPGLLELKDFRRMGDAPDPETGGRIIYVATRLRLARAHDFGGWSGGTLQALSAALGAGPRGIRGVARGGNAAGDLLRANGSIRVKRNGDVWVALAGGAAAGRPAAMEGPGGRAEQLLTAIQTALTAIPRATGGPASVAIEQELAQAWRNIEGRLARIERGLPLAGGAAGSEYARLAAALAGLPATPDRPAMTALPSAGSVENLRLLADGTALLALAQADVAGQAFRGEAGAAMPGLRALASLFPEAVHVIVPAASPLRQMADLAGRRIGVGIAGSGARVTAEAVLAAYGLTDATRVPLAPDAVAAALASGQVAAHIAVSLAPAQAVLRIADTVPLRLLPLDPDAVTRLAPLLPFSIPAGAYPGLDAPLMTAATPALLVGDAALTTAEVGAILTALFRAPSLAALGGPAALQITPATARQGLTLPLHPGAEAFFATNR
ncbi:TAXI family TRAP transporter solute-binding subunit [Humitalea sp. 24SJ18S-53]|uniref:TAXI family TRAP transporter solute-binding subunit n=1 Tax=Humitalea sp. 24SJ18S-53 TaxID=3422307 RepID=UPI003D66ACFD